MINTCHGGLLYPPFESNSTFDIYKVNFDGQIYLDNSIYLSPLYKEDISDLRFCQFSGRDFIFYSMKSGKIFGNNFNSPTKNDIYYYLLEKDIQIREIYDFQCIQDKKVIMSFDDTNHKRWLCLMRVGEALRNDRRIIALVPAPIEVAAGQSLGENRIYYFLSQMLQNKGMHEGAYLLVKLDMMDIGNLWKPFLKYYIRGPVLKLKYKVDCGSQSSQALGECEFGEQNFDFSILIKNSGAAVTIPGIYTVASYIREFRIEPLKSMESRLQADSLKGTYSLSQFVSIKGPFSRSKFDFPPWFNRHMWCSENLKHLDSSTIDVKNGINNFIASDLHYAAY
jgi:hypothetical protein